MKFKIENTRNFLFFYLKKGTNWRYSQRTHSARKYPQQSTFNRTKSKRHVRQAK